MEHGSEWSWLLLVGREMRRVVRGLGLDGL